MLTNAEITGIADEVLRATLGPSGFERAQVMDDVDQDGEPALMVTARFKAGAHLDNGEVVVNALSALRDKLLARGEERFPYLRFNVEGESRPSTLTTSANMPSKNPLADGLLEVADVLLKQRGRPIFVQAALRWSISTAYYAVFHTLCQVCGDGFRLWTLGGDERRLAVFLLFDPKNPVREKRP